MPAEPAAAPAVDAPSDGAVARVARMWWAPPDVFAAVSRRTSLAAAGLALVFLILGSAGTQLVLLTKIDQEAVVRKAITESPFGGGREMKDEDLEQAVKMAKTFAWVGPGVSVVTLPISFLLLGTIFFLGMKLAGSGAEYLPIFETVTLAFWPPSAAKAAVFVLTALTRSALDPESAQMLVRSNPGTFLPGLPAAARAALGAFDVFTIWTVILLVLGLSAVGKVKTKRAATVVLVLFGVWTLLKVGGALLLAIAGGMAGA